MCTISHHPQRKRDGSSKRGKRSSKDKKKKRKSSKKKKQKEKEKARKERRRRSSSGEREAPARAKAHTTVQGRGQRALLSEGLSLAASQQHVLHHRCSQPGVQLRAGWLHRARMHAWCQLTPFNSSHFKSHVIQTTCTQPPAGLWQVWRHPRGGRRPQAQRVHGLGARRQKGAAAHKHMRSATYSHAQLVPFVAKPAAWPRLAACKPQVDQQGP